MAQDQQEDRKSSGPPRPGRIMLAGIVVATTLGAGLGLWARPAPPPEPDPEAAAPPLQAVLEVVVDDSPAPIGPLLEVLPAEMAAAAAAAGPTSAPPRRMAAPVGAGAVPLPVVVLPRTEPTRIAVKAELAPRKAAKRVKRETATKPTVMARTKKAQKLAEAEPKATRKAEVKLAEAKPAKPRPKKIVAKSAAEKPPTRLAKAAPERKALERKAPGAARPAPRGEGPVRTARDDCALTDPGAALVCADRRLEARDRQLQRAYRRAEAAGVPPSALQRQQARWLQARAAAAREAPWAVEDVYVARISEINDMISDARAN